MRELVLEEEALNKWGITTVAIPRVAVDNGDAREFDNMVLSIAVTLSSSTFVLFQWTKIRQYDFAARYTRLQIFAPPSCGIVAESDLCIVENTAHHHSDAARNVLGESRMTLMHSSR